MGMEIASLETREEDLDVYNYLAYDAGYYCKLFYVISNIYIDLNGSR
jgi:hypothetical protein